MFVVDDRTSMEKIVCVVEYREIVERRVICVYIQDPPLFFLFFFFNDPAITEIYTLSQNDALPI